MNQYHYVGGPNRVMCEVLEEMRSCYKTRNFCGLLGLIEEAQSMANRMESGLGDVRDLKGIQDAITREKKVLRELENKKDNPGETK